MLLFLMVFYYRRFPLLDKAFCLWDSWPMKILYLISQRPDSTGSGTYTRALIAQAVKAGHNPSLVCAGSALNPPDVSAIEVSSVYRVLFDQASLSFPIPGMSDVMPYPSSRFMDLDDVQLDAYEQVFGRTLDKAVSETRPDIIHSNHLWILSALARKRFPNIPMVVSCHGTALRQFQNCPQIRPRVLPALSGLDGVFALSESQKHEIMALYGVPEDTIHVVANGFDPEVFYPAPKPQAPPVIVLYAGKLAEAKGVPLLLECLSHESLRDLPFHLYLAGSGTDEHTCRAMARRVSENVTFLGALSPNDLGEFMRKAHLFVQPSFFEGVPLVVIEALASGCRVVATDLPGTRSLMSEIKGDWGQWVPLPELETVDRPFAKDLPLIRDRLAQALSFQIRNRIMAQAPQPDVFESLAFSHSWQRVFCQVHTVYQSFTSSLP